MVSLKEYMAEERTVSRWTILSAGIVGAFCGASLTVVFLIGAVTVQ